MPPRLRPYKSVVRARQAEATRRSILTAARRLFALGGYQSTTMDAIAAAAEVSTPTVYATFKSKQRILGALVAGAVGDPDIRTIAARAEAERDPVRKIRKAAHVMRLALESEEQLLEVLWQAGSGDAELMAAWRQMHSNRHRRLTEVLAPISKGVRSRRIVDVAWALGSPEMYRLLVRERGWTAVLYEKWLADSLVSLHAGAL